MAGVWARDPLPGLEKLGPGWWFCNLCGCDVAVGHVQSAKHYKRLGEHGLLDEREATLLRHQAARLALATKATDKLVIVKGKACAFRIAMETLEDSVPADHQRYRSLNLFLTRWFPPRYWWRAFHFEPRLREF